MGVTAGSSEAVRRATELAERGEHRAAVDLLQAIAIADGDPEAERLLPRLRHRAVAAMAGGPQGAPPPVVDDPFVDGEVPEVGRDGLDAATLRAAISRHGCLLVRGFIDPAASAVLVDHIGRALEARDAHLEDPSATSPWYEPFEAADGYSFGAMERTFVRSLGGLLAIESPRTLARVLDAFERVGLRDLLHDYFGEPPVLSAKKSTLRRTAPDAPTEWHQDGAFLGAATRSLNVWVSLTPSGVTAPGLDVIPHAFDDIVETGTEGSLFPWSVAPAQVSASAGVPHASPVFAAGDALLFDQMLLHRTGVRPEMTDTRYAIESWFFAPSTYPFEQVPVLY